MPETTTKRPFGFAPYPSSVASGRAPTGHDAFEGRSGELVCELEALSPFLVMDSEKQDGGFMHDNRGFLIPPTSLKGMVRSVFEVLTDSCVPLSATGRRNVPAYVSKCDSVRKLCPACRVFGHLDVRGGREGGQDGRVHRGQVGIGEARPVFEPQQSRPVEVIPLYGPKPSSRHYFERGKPKGRKFYYHQREVQTRHAHQAHQAAPSGGRVALSLRRDLREPRRTTNSPRSWRRSSSATARR